MASSAEQIRAFTGPAILSYGFRPFFLAGAIWAALSVALWLPLLSGHVALPTAFAPLDWHSHELVFGYVPAIVAGFLLTAVPNWTGRLPVVGWPLLALFSTWIAGRMAILCSGMIGAPLAAFGDLAFLLALAAVIAREIIAAGNTRNLKVLAAVGLLFTGNLIFHIEAARGLTSGYGLRFGVAATVMLIMLIGGRIVPSFTRNWLAPRKSDRLPAPFDRFDVAAMAIGALALVCWIALPASVATAWLAAAAAVINAARLMRWQGWRTSAEPLVFILHIGFAFVPLGFALLSLAIVRPDVIVPTGALHAWTAGAIGVMTLAVMTRASLGHTGMPLSATRPIQAIYAAAIIAALARIVAAFGVARAGMLHVSALAWVLAFAGFVIVYWPLLTRPRT